MKKVFLVCAILLFSTVQASRIIITGTVYDELGNGIPSATIVEKATSNKTTTDVNGNYTLVVSSPQNTLVFSCVDYQPKEVKIGSRRKIDVILKASVPTPPAIAKYETKEHSLAKPENKTRFTAFVRYTPESDVAFNTESYSAIEENRFHRSTDKPLSTFSIDVDAASYSNIRRFINQGSLPPKDAVRIEEMINYFHYDYDGPTHSDPFAIHTAKIPAPWNSDHHLVSIGLQGKKLQLDQLPPSNIVFLLDVSGSMNAPNKLPLLKASLKMLTYELKPSDKVSIVVYAGAAKLVLPPTEGNDKKAIIKALEKLQAGGFTAGDAGIQLAYETARKHFVKGGNNRVILATDGDFNIGASSDAEIQRLIEAKRKEGIFLTVLGFGMGNYKDSKMEILADKGNGNYAYIDNILEAKKVLVTEFGGTLHTIAKDVKIQVEFNPQVVQAYRLIGYENRTLNDEDFNDDTKDAGELGSGHTVTALYEIIPIGVKSAFVQEIDELKYQKTTSVKNTDEMLTVKFRYKAPDGAESRLITHTLANDAEYSADENANWAATVAAFGMLLRDSEFKGDLTYAKVLELAKQNHGKDEYGYRAECIKLLEVAQRLKNDFN